MVSSERGHRGRVVLITSTAAALGSTAELKSTERVSYWRTEVGTMSTFFTADHHHNNNTVDGDDHWSISRHRHSRQPLVRFLRL